MANLLQTIQQNRAKLTDQSQTGTTDQTQQVQQLLRAKSGQQVGPSDTAISNLGEQQANSSTKAQVGQLAANNQIQQQQETTQAAGQTQQAQQQQQQIAQTNKYNSVQAKLQTNQIIQNLQQQQGQLSLEQKKSQMEQAGFLLSMQDKQYTDQLMDVGRRQRLDDQSNFQDEMQRLSFGDNMDLLNQKLGESNILSASDQQFQKVLSDMSIENAIQISDTEMQHMQHEAEVQQDLAKFNGEQAAKNANAQGMWGGIGNIVSGATQAVGLGMSASGKTGPAPVTSSNTDTANTSLASRTA